MEVVYYQLFIAITILLTNVIKKDYLLWVCGGWTVLTLANLFHPPLIAIQLGVVWGTYWLLTNNDAKNQKINDLERATSALPIEQRKKVEIVSHDYKRLLSGVEHYAYLMDSLGQANSRVTVLSGWLSARVVDEAFTTLMRKKTKEGVRFYLGYGWQDSQGTHQAGKDSRAALHELKELAMEFPEYVSVAEYATHEKILIVDSKVAVFGSANWLSNRKYKNSERSIVITDSALARSEERRIQVEIEKHRVS